MPIRLVLVKSLHESQKISMAVLDKVATVTHTGGQPITCYITLCSLPVVMPVSHRVSYAEAATHHACEGFRTCLQPSSVMQMWRWVLHNCQGGLKLMV